MRSSSSMELVIQKLLLQNSQLDLIADQLFRQFDNQSLSLEDLEVLAQFFLSCGYTASLARFLAKKLDEGSSPIPWPHFVETLLLSQEQLEPEIKKALIEGAAAHGQLQSLCRTKKLDHYSPALEDSRRGRRRLIWDRHLKDRRDLLQKFDMIRSQGLWQEEEKILEQLLVLHPRDEDMRNKKADFRQRRALDVMSFKQNTKVRARLPNLGFEEFTSAEIEILDALTASQKMATPTHPHLIEDFAVFHLMIEAPDRALEFSAQSQTVAGDWLHAEGLLRSRKFVDLLDFLAFLEAHHGEDPETVFGVIYLRAQALWGLEHRFSAIELIEGLLSVRPQYRSAISLLEQWKEDYA
jgi:hypothetical protein